MSTSGWKPSSLIAEPNTAILSSASEKTFPDLLYLADSSSSSESKPSIHIILRQQICPVRDFPFNKSAMDTMLLHQSAEGVCTKETAAKIDKQLNF